MIEPVQVDMERSYDWRFQARCLRAPDPDLWFAKNEREKRLAKHLYNDRCPVKDFCRAANDRYESTHLLQAGIWAGEDPRERLRRRSEPSRRLPDGTSRVPNRAHAHGVYDAILEMEREELMPEHEPAR